MHGPVGWVTAIGNSKALSSPVSYAASQAVGAAMRRDGVRGEGVGERHMRSETGLGSAGAGGFGENAYLVWREGHSDAVAIDPGGEADAMAAHASQIGS